MVWFSFIHMYFVVGAGVGWGGGIQIIEPDGGGLGFVFLVSDVSDFKLRFPSSDEPIFRVLVCLSSGMSCRPIMPGISTGGCRY